MGIGSDRNATRCAARFVGALALFLAACAPLPQRTGLPVEQRPGLPVEQRPSPNFDQRRPDFVILHHTGDADAERSLRTLSDPQRKVSSHYLVARSGRIYYLVDELARAWHAGESYWGGNRDMNSASIGIELDNDGEGSYPAEQIESLLALLADIKKRYRIPAANFLGHGDVAPGRKTDPGPEFPWQRLAGRGFGLWCEPPWANAPPGVSTAMLLAAFGYDVSDPDAAAAAFKRHFAPGDDTQQMSGENRALLYCLVSRRQAGEDE